MMLAWRKIRSDAWAAGTLAREKVDAAYSETKLLSTKDLTNKIRNLVVLTMKAN